MSLQSEGYTYEDTIGNNAIILLVMRHDQAARLLTYTEIEIEQ